MILNKQREILFRGKAKNGEWVYGYPVAPIEHGIRGEKTYAISTYSEMKVSFDGYFRKDMRRIGYEVYPKTIGQYTGINDCTGKKIFEHDIVRCRISPRLMLDDFDKLFEDIPKELTGQVVMDKGAWVVKDHRGISFQLGYVYEPKVLGNVFDDFELLEEQT